MPQDADAGGVVLTAHFKADAHEHEYVEVEGTKTAATCLKAGSAKYKCKICGEVIEKDIKPLGHDWDDGVQKGAEIIYTCKREGCGETKVEAAKATPTPSPSPTPQPTAAPVVTTAPTAVPTAAPTAVPATPEPTAVPTPTPEPHTHDFQLISDTGPPARQAAQKPTDAAAARQKRRNLPHWGTAALHSPTAVLCAPAAARFCRPHLRQNQLRRVNQQRKVTPPPSNHHVRTAHMRPLQV